MEAAMCAEIATMIQEQYAAPLQVAELIHQFGRGVLRSVPLHEPVNELPAAFLGRATHAFGAVQLLYRAGMPDAALPMRLITELLIELAYIYVGRTLDEARSLSERYKEFQGKHDFDMHERSRNSEDLDTYYDQVLWRLRKARKLIVQIATGRQLYTHLKEVAERATAKWNYDRYSWAPHTAIAQRARVAGVTWIYNEAFAIGSIYGHAGIGTLMSIMEATPDGLSMECDPFVQPPGILLLGSRGYLHLARLCANIYEMDEADSEAERHEIALRKAYDLEQPTAHSLMMWPSSLHR
jgi:hypothetical protein